MALCWGETSERKRGLYGRTRSGRLEAYRVFRRLRFRARKRHKARMSGRVGSVGLRGYPPAKGGPTTGGIRIYRSSFIK